MTLYLDYGQIQQAKERPNGSIVAYARIAMADIDYKYLNSDGSIRTERISRDQLFDSASIDTLKMQPITLGHPPSGTNPDNYQDNAIGSVGNLIVNGLDGDFLGVIASIQRRDAIDAYKAGKIRQFSPVYSRQASLSDGIFWQRDRRYEELGFVEMARGGAACTLKDAADVAIFDQSQVDDDMIQLWGDSRGLQQDAIDRLLTHGTLTPTPIILPPMTLIPVTIGGKSLQIDSANAETAVALAAEYKDSSKLTDSLAKAEVALALAKEKLAKAEIASAALKDSLGDKIRDAVARLADSRKELAMLTATGEFDGSKATIALDAMDIPSYQMAIVSQKSPTATMQDSAGVATIYKYLVDSYSQQQQTIKLPSTGMVSAVTGSMSSGAEMEFNQIEANMMASTRINGLPPEQDWE